MKMQMKGIDVSEALRQTDRIINSQVFARAKRSQRLLRYLVDAALADPPRLTKEYTIATEIFDRDPAYDPAIDATVRVEAGRLRSRLREYYSGEGKEDAILIEMPKGAYRVVLTERVELTERPTEVHRSVIGAASGPGESERWPAAEADLQKDWAGSASEQSPTDRVQVQKRLAFRRWMKVRRTWRYAVLLPAFGLVLGYAGWRTARFQFSHSITNADLRSVAVLPLKNLSGDPAQDYFADGTTDELITQLARVPELRVVSWNSVVQEKDTKKSLKAIATELRADLLVEGSISRSGDTVRINAQLIDTKNDDHLWADSFEGPLNNVIYLENKAAAEIVDHARIGTGSRSAGSAARQMPVIDAAAHDAYLRGRNYFDKRQARAGAEQFQRAIDLSPTYAPAYAGLAIALQSEALLGDARPEQVIPEAMAAVQKSLDLDPDNGDALIARGGLETTFLWTWDAAERDLTRGIDLSPNNSYGRMMLSVYLDSVGRADEAVAQMQKAVEVDPLSFYMARHYGSTLFYARRYDEALRQLTYARDMHPASAGTVDHWIRDVYEKKGMHDDAVRTDLLWLQDIHSKLSPHKLLAVYRQRGWRAYWAARLQELHGDNTDPLHNYEVGLVAMRAGRPGEAIGALKRALNEHCYWMGTARVDPTLDDLRGDPAFAELLRDLPLPPDPKR